MDSTRKKRLETAIRQELSVIIPQGVKDPRVPSLTVTRVDLADDTSHATVFFSMFDTSQLLESNDSSEQTESTDDRQVTRECIRGLNSAKGFLKRHISKKIRMRNTPDLMFKRDKGMENTFRVHQLLETLKRENEPTAN